MHNFDNYSHEYKTSRIFGLWKKFCYPTKEPTMSCWRYTPTPKQDCFQDLLEAICPHFLHTTLTKYNNYHCYFNIPQLLSAEVVLCMHKTTILSQFGLFRHQLTTISPSILNHFWWELYQINSLIVGLPS